MACRIGKLAATDSGSSLFLWFSGSSRKHAREGNGSVGSAEKPLLFSMMPLLDTTTSLLLSVYCGRCDDGSLGNIRIAFGQSDVNRGDVQCAYCGRQVKFEGASRASFAVGMRDCRVKLGWTLCESTELQYGYLYFVQEATGFRMEPRAGSEREREIGPLL